MAETSEQTPQQKGWPAFVKHVKDNKVNCTMYGLRLLTIFFTIQYFIPIFWPPASSYYKALLASAAINALRLHQRLGTSPINQQFLSWDTFKRLLSEDSCHYLLYSLIFLGVTPVTMVLVPVFLFAFIQAASYSLPLLDTFGQNSWWGARLLISLVEFQSYHILRLISLAEIFLMPFSIILSLLDSSWIFTPMFYYGFLLQRYMSQRNPHTRNMFMEIRQWLESVAHKPMTPAFVRSVIMSMITLVCRLGPQISTLRRGRANRRRVLDLDRS